MTASEYAEPPPAPRVLTCPACDTVFTTSTPTKVFCDGRCKIKAKRQRERQRLREHRGPAPQRVSPCVDCGVRLASGPRSR